MPADQPRRFQGPFARWPRAADAALAVAVFLAAVFFADGPDDSVVFRSAGDVPSPALVVFAVGGAATPRGSPGDLPGRPGRGRRRRVGRAHLGPRLPAGLAPHRALAHLEADRGAHFDPRCLDAFLALMAERGHRPGGRDHDPVPAEESCHPHPPAAKAVPGR